jgi:hypothetical protein
VRGLVSASLSSSLEDDILGFGLLFGRWSDDSESEDASILALAAGIGVGLGRAGPLDVGLSSILFSSCFDGPVELEKLPVFLTAGSSASDSVVESGSIGFA